VSEYAMSKRSVSASLALVLACGAAAVLTGCGGRSYMDPSVTGRWQHTPTIVPILDRLASIEDDRGEFVESTPPIAEDLIPRPESYRIGPGDILEVTAYDLIEQGQAEQYEVVVDPRGTIELPQLGRIAVGGKTTQDAITEIEDVIKARNLVQDPLVTVVARSQRGQTFTVIGAVQSPGLYPIPRADYRLLEAISAAGQFDDSIPEVFVIRQVPLSEEVREGIGGPARTGTELPGEERPMNGGDQPTADELIDIIAPERPREQTPPPSPSAMRDAVPAPRARRQDEAPAQPPPPPPIDLIEPETASDPRRAEESGNWIFVNGRWVKVKAATPAEAAATGARPDELITQRVIRVPLKELLSGRQAINVVIRPGDVIRFPSAQSGFVWIGGQINRPGPYQITSDMTLQRAIMSAGGLGETAIPWRVDVTRLVGDNRQATIRLDLDAIGRQLQPDIYVKPGDMINIGTNFWALPLAVTRNGLRVSYGFGFILDRNLSNDLFGPPPVNQFGN